jgi:alpha-D-ribose 1-methylphosphonate 5-phosphate C-P lyase
MDLEREHKRLLERGAQWAALSSKGPLSGKAALRSYVEGALAIPGFQISWATSEKSLSPGWSAGISAGTLVGLDGMVCRSIY